MKKIITVVSGTNRKGSNTRKIAKLAVKRLEAKGIEVKFCDLLELPRGLFESEHYWNAPETFAPFQEKILNTNGLLVVTPEYNGSFPGVLKYFIDLLKFPDSLRGMPTAFIGLGDGVFGGLRSIEQLTQIFQYREAPIFGKKTLFMGVNKKLSEDGTEITDEFTKKKFAETVDGFADWIAEYPDAK